MGSMAKVSAGLVLFRGSGEGLEVLLVHPGGPFWAKKDEGAWSIPKGEAEAGEELLAAAMREVEEELGFRPEGEPMPLTPVKQKGGKVVHAWAMAWDCDPGAIRSNTFEMEWPPRSGKRAAFPEVDRAAYFDVETARRKINGGQAGLLEEVVERMGRA